MPRKHLCLSGISYCGFPAGEIDLLFCVKVTILQKPEGWKYTPDLLQFYEAKTTAEQELYLIFLEYRQRAFQGAFHSNPDYMHWYGWAKVKEAAVRIKEDAARLRKEHKK
jgi:hydroxylamine dehydrogenase